MAIPGADERWDAEISLNDAGSLLGVSSEWIRRLIKSGHIERVKRGRTTARIAVRGYVQFLKESARETTKAASTTRAQEARTREVELRIAERQRDLIPLEEAALAMDHVVNKVREEMNGLAARVTRELELRRKIEAEVHGAQTRIANALEEGRIFASQGGDAPSASAADNA